MPEVEELKELLDRQLDAVAGCRRPGDVCVVEVVPGLDHAALARALRAGGRIWAWCHTNASRDRYVGLGRADLVDSVIASVLPGPFAPLERSRARRLHAERERLFRRAARDLR